MPAIVRRSKVFPSVRIAFPSRTFVPFVVEALFVPIESSDLKLVLPRSYTYTPL